MVPKDDENLISGVWFSHTDPVHTWEHLWSDFAHHFRRRTPVTPVIWCIYVYSGRNIPWILARAPVRTASKVLIMWSANETHEWEMKRWTPLWISHAAESDFQTVSQWWIVYFPAWATMQSMQLVLCCWMGCIETHSRSHYTCGDITVCG